MSCTRMRRLIGIYRDLDRAERRMLTAHLRDCETCRSTWLAEQDLQRRIQAIPELDPPAGFEGRLLRIPSLLPARPRVWSLPRLLPLALLGLGGLLGLGQGPARLVPGSPALRQASESAADYATESQGREVAASRRAFLPPVPRLSSIPLRTPYPSPDPVDPAEAPVIARAERPAREPAPAVTAEQPAPASQGQGRTPGGSNASHDTSSNKQGSRRQPPTPTADRADPTEPPQPSPVAETCVALTVEVFADCPDCDGLLPPGLEIPLPSDIFWSVYDLDDMALGEGTLQTGGASRIEQPLPQLCGRLPLTLSLKLTDPAWRSCPVGGQGLQRQIAVAGAQKLAFGLTRGCPAPTPTATVPPETPAPSATPEASATPATPEPTAHPTGIAAGHTPNPPGPGPRPTEPGRLPDPDPPPAEPPIEPPGPSPEPGPDTEEPARR